VINIKKTFFVILIYLSCVIESYSSIKDGLFATVGSKAITRSDIVNEIKTILILSGQNYSTQNAQQLENVAINSTIKRIVKQIEVEKYDDLRFNENDLYIELDQMAKNANLELDTLKNIFIANDIDFSNIKEQIRTELKWNSLIFQLYKDRLSVNINEINEQLKLIQNKKEIEEFLISEIIIKSVPKEDLQAEIKKIKNKIKAEGFKNVAITLSISETALKGGDLGWVNENIISDKFKTKIAATPIGDISEPIILPQGILFFKVRDKRKIEKFLNLEEAKNQLIKAEKTKILNMHSLSHYDNLRRSIAINYFQ